jgi:hypothetical protein
MQSGPSLPHEISLCIIDYLYNCPKSLKNCSRVCRAWLATSRFHLFYHISFVLNGRHTSDRFQRLHSIIEQSPIIALYIRELVILRNSKLPDSEWPKLVMVVPLLFGKLTSLQKLDLRGFYWSRLTPDARSSVRTLLSLPSLVHLAVRDITVSKLEHFTAILPPNLKQLTVDRVQVRTGDAELIKAIDMENDQVSPRNPRRLEYLRVCESFVFNDWLLGEQSQVDISNIHTLVICDRPEKISKLVRGLESSLEHLKFPYFPGGPHYFNR